MVMMRLAIYARVSTKGVGRQDAENQLRQLRAFAESQLWIVVDEFVDRLSGKTADREQFQLMFQSASIRGFDVLLFWSLDRLSREGTVATLNHLQRLNSYGVGYRSFTEQFLDSTGIFKEAVVGILAAVARQEGVRLSESTIAGLQRAKAPGRVGGRPRIEHDPRTMAKLAALGGRRFDSADRQGTGFESHHGGTSGKRAGNTGTLNPPGELPITPVNR
jgi:DNA invertase Pin-like site-specific DNA recombinase